MKRFVCYTLEGLVSQNGQQVWVTVATVNDPDQVANIKLGESYLETRLLPYYRDLPTYVTNSDHQIRVDHEAEKRHLPAAARLPMETVMPYVSA